MTSNLKSLDSFAAIAAETAMRSFADYARSRKSEVDCTVAVATLRRLTRERLPAALDDAKLAIEANMGQVAEATFLASMRLVGIDAAKEVLA